MFSNVLVGVDGQFGGRDAIAMARQPADWGWLRRIAQKQTCSGCGQNACR